MTVGESALPVRAMQLCVKYNHEKIAFAEGWSAQHKTDTVAINYNSQILLNVSRYILKKMMPALFIWDLTSSILGFSNNNHL